MFINKKKNEKITFNHYQPTVSAVTRDVNFHRKLGVGVFNFNNTIKPAKIQACGYVQYVINQADAVKLMQSIIKDPIVIAQYLADGPKIQSYIEAILNEMILNRTGYHSNNIGVEFQISYRAFNDAFNNVMRNLIFSAALTKDSNLQKVLLVLKPFLACSLGVLNILDYGKMEDRCVEIDEKWDSYLPSSLNELKLLLLKKKTIDLTTKIITSNEMIALTQFLKDLNVAEQAQLRNVKELNNIRYTKVVAVRNRITNAITDFAKQISELSFNTDNLEALMAISVFNKIKEHFSTTQKRNCKMILLNFNKISDNVKKAIDMISDNYFLFNLAYRSISDIQLFEYLESALGSEQGPSLLLDDIATNIINLFESEYSLYKVVSINNFLDDINITAFKGFNKLNVSVLIEKKFVSNIVTKCYAGHFHYTSDDTYPVMSYKVNKLSTYTSPTFCYREGEMVIAESDLPKAIADIALMYSNYQRGRLIRELGRNAERITSNVTIYTLGISEYEKDIIALSLCEGIGYDLRMSHSNLFDDEHFGIKIAKSKDNHLPLWWIGKENVDISEANLPDSADPTNNYAYTNSLISYDKHKIIGTLATDKAATDSFKIMVIDNALRNRKLSINQQVELSKREIELPSGLEYQISFYSSLQSSREITLLIKYDNLYNTNVGLSRSLKIILYPFIELLRDIGNIYSIYADISKAQALSEFNSNFNLTLSDKALDARVTNLKTRNISQGLISINDDGVSLDIDPLLTYLYEWNLLSEQSYTRPNYLSIDLVKLASGHKDFTYDVNYDRTAVALSSVSKILPDILVERLENYATNKEQESRYYTFKYSNYTFVENLLNNEHISKWIKTVYSEFNMSVKNHTNMIALRSIIQQDPIYENKKIFDLEMLVLAIAEFEGYCIYKNSFRSKLAKNAYYKNLKTLYAISPIFRLVMDTDLKILRSLSSTYKATNLNYVFDINKYALHETSLINELNSEIKMYNYLVNSMKARVPVASSTHIEPRHMSNKIAQAQLENIQNKTKQLVAEAGGDDNFLQQIQEVE